ncbi:MAG: M1 family metallopeptidase [Aureispira sp.]|nr:M1 family metallopeptidase [Aureispira sp.]
MTKTNSFLILLALCITHILAAQTPEERWQQSIDYTMDIKMDVDEHQFAGTQKLVYTNNSPDQLKKVFYHLYFNAFQPGSMMDIRSRTIQDADPRVKSRIEDLDKDEIGFLKIKSLKQDGEEVKYKVEGTILEVTLAKPIEPNSSVTFDMEFDGQVPLQIRRSGRQSAEGIDYSMTQWYPKLCEYDYQGWHSNPYVGREFHGVWGNFDVKITMPANYIIGATGNLVNNNEIGHGYEDVGMKPDNKNKKELTWNFKAENVHDFAWAADPDYVHDVVDVSDDLKLHFLYQDDEEIKKSWKKAQSYSVRAFKFIQTRYGKYPYNKYSIIQGGDGGMEYPMATLITGKRNLGSLVGVIVHEAMHTWFQMLMATNESLYAWMDEGFTSYASNVVMAHLFNSRASNPHDGSYRGYFYLANSGSEEPLTTHADHFKTNFAYGQASYSKGAVFLAQLEYVIGEGAFNQGMLDYYDQWHFKHPNPNDFIRVMEKRSGLELDWYKEHWVNTTNTIDYAIGDVIQSNKKTKDTELADSLSQNIGIKANVGDSKPQTTIILQKKGTMPMPLDVVVQYEDGKAIKEQTFYIPLRVMRGEKADEVKYGKRTVMPDWPWTHVFYELSIPIKYKSIMKVTIDPSERLADLDRENNVLELK